MAKPNRKAGRQPAGRKLAPKPKRPRKSPQTAPEAPKRPRQGRLPGTEDNKILDIEEAAIEHSDIRSEITAKKVDLKAVEDKLAALMNREGKKDYHRGSIHVRLRAGHDAVSVQVKRHDREDGEEEGQLDIDVAEADEESGEITG